MSPSAPAAASETSAVDRAVSSTAAPVVMRIIYAVPSDVAADPGLPAAIRHEMGFVSAWFAAQTGGKRPRLVMRGGAFEVRVVKLRVTRRALEAAERRPWRGHFPIEDEIKRVLPLAPGERRVIYTPLVHPLGCGITSTTASLFPMLTCGRIPNSRTPSFPWGATYLTAHEMTHLFGAVPRCAPHYDGTGHVNNDPRDILYQGRKQRDWLHITLDPGHDDYYRHGRAGCVDIAKSPYWQ